MKGVAHGWIQTCSLCHREVGADQRFCPNCLKSGNGTEPDGDVNE